MMLSPGVIHIETSRDHVPRLVDPAPDPEHLLVASIDEENLKRVQDLSEAICYWLSLHFDEIGIGELESNEDLSETVSESISPDRLFFLLQSGVLLCRLTLRIFNPDPDTFSFHKDAKAFSLLARENLVSFREFLISRFPSMEVFQPDELIEKSNELSVLESIATLLSLAEKGGFKPFRCAASSPRTPSLRRKEFTIDVSHIFRPLPSLEEEKISTSELEFVSEKRLLRKDSSQDTDMYAGIGRKSEKQLIQRKDSSSDAEVYAGVHRSSVNKLSCSRRVESIQEDSKDVEEKESLHTKRASKEFYSRKQSPILEEKDFPFLEDLLIKKINSYSVAMVSGQHPVLMI